MCKKNLLILGLFIFLQHAYCQMITRTEMVGRPTNSGITVKAVFDTTVEVRIKYGLTSGLSLDSTSWQIFTIDGKREAVAEIELVDLTPNTRYRYLLQYRSVGDPSMTSRPEHTFRTARARGETFTFTIEADPHLDASSDTALFRRCLNNQLEDDPDFMFDLGDFLMSEKLKNASNVIPEDTVPYRCKLLRSFYESINHSVPLYIALGNHEGETGWFRNGTANNIAVWSTTYRKKYFSNPKPNGFYSGDTTHYDFIGQREANYAWEWGDALFIVVDPYWFTSPKPDSLHCWRWSLGKQQYDWLRTTLESSTAKFKFVFCHQMIGANKDGRGGIEGANTYEWGGNNIDNTNGWDANRPGWYKPIKELLEENRVTIFFHGHDHLFAKQELNCLVYQEVPQPSLPNFANPPTQAVEYNYSNGVIASNSGYLRVTVSPDSVTVDYVRAFLPTQENPSRHNKEISYSYAIEAVNCYDSLQTEVPLLNNENFTTINIFPNPFSVSSKIELNVSKTETASLEIFNSFGVLVKTLESGKVERGLHCYEFSGIECSSGVYHVRFTAGENVTTNKMILIKQ